MARRLKFSRFGALVLGVALAVAAPIVAKTFIYFAPATGILKGDANDFHTTAATGTDIVATFTGTCNSSTVLKGDGTCGSAGGSGVTSVDAAGTGIFSFTGGPITTTGTLTLAQAGTSGGVPYFSNGTTLASSGALTASRLVLGGGAAAAPTVLGSLGTTTTLLHGNAAGAPTFGAVALATDVSGNLPVTNLNSGTSADNTHFWRGDGTWAVPSSSGVSQTTSNFTSTFTNGCITNPTVVWNYVLTGSQVTMRVASTSGFVCTGSTTSFATASGDTPLALRPAATLTVGYFGCTDNGNNVPCMVRLLADGTLQLCAMASATPAPTCGSTNWTNSGNRSFLVTATGANTAISYNLN